MAKLRPADEYTTDEIGLSAYHLRAALQHAKAGKAPKLAGAIRRALKSADGAARHAQRRVAAMEGRDDG